MRLIAIAALVLGMATMAAAQDNTQWEYSGKTGPQLWGRMDPSWRACAKGREQSPIDIKDAHLNKDLPPIEVHYIAGPITLKNTGKTIVAQVDPGSYIVINGLRYELTGFDFHHPAEHEFRGKFSDMEVHLMHQSADGKQVILAVRLIENAGNPNAVLATLWEHLPKFLGKSEKVTDMVSPAGILPADRGYWTYMGSLDTPPCTEGVRWFVFEQQVSVSREQLRTFAALYKLNTRPTQDLNHRRIEANE